jgi:hypothetical protein
MKRSLPEVSCFRKAAPFLTAALLLAFMGGAAGAEVEVFFLPEGGFIRVQGEVTMEPLGLAPSFLLFPGAQVTELWADELVEYNVQRGLHGTMVSMTLRQARPQVLSFAYEGFLDLQGTLLSLDRNSLWFPEFSFPIDGAEIKISLPNDWELTEWESKPPQYPSFSVRSLNADLLETEAAAPQVEVPVVDELTSRIQMQVSRLTNAMNQRNSTEMEAILAPSLRDSGLASFLASLPPSYGRLTGEVKDPFTIIFSAERGFRYQASTVWQEQGGRLVLLSFRLKPHGPQVPEELFASLAEFAEELRLAVQTKNREGVLPYLDENLAQDRGQVLEFLLSLNTAVPWSVEHAVLEPFTATLHVPHSPRTQLLVNLGLVPGEDHWLISRIEVIPLR